MAVLDYRPLVRPERRQGARRVANQGIACQSGQQQWTGLECLEDRVLLSGAASSIHVLAPFDARIGSPSTVASGAALAIDAHGNLFGVSPRGGSSGAGDVFEVAKGEKTIANLASFKGTSGRDP